MKVTSPFYYDKKNGNIKFIMKDQFYKMFGIKTNMTYKDIISTNKHFSKLDKGIFYAKSNNITIIGLIDKTLDDFQTYCTKHKLPFNYNDLNNSKNSATKENTSSNTKNNTNSKENTNSTKNNISSKDIDKQSALTNTTQNDKIKNIEVQKVNDTNAVNRQLLYNNTIESQKLNEPSNMTNRNKTYTDTTNNPNFNFKVEQQDLNDNSDMIKRKEYYMKTIKKTATGTFLALALIPALTLTGCSEYGSEYAHWGDGYFGVEYNESTTAVPETAKPYIPDEYSGSNNDFYTDESTVNYNTNRQHQKDYVEESNSSKTIIYTVLPDNNTKAKEIYNKYLGESTNADNKIEVNIDENGAIKSVLDGELLYAGQDEAKDEGWEIREEEGKDGLEGKLFIVWAGKGKTSSITTNGTGKWTENKWAGYSEEVQKAIELTDGKTAEEMFEDYYYNAGTKVNDTTTLKDAIKKLREEGLTYIYENYNPNVKGYNEKTQKNIDKNIIKVVTKAEAYEYYKQENSWYVFVDEKDTWADAGQEVINLKNKQEDAANLKLALSFVRENTDGGVNKYYNSLGTNEYTTIDGFVVPTESNRNSLGSNTTAEKWVAYQAELETFKKNNPNCTFISSNGYTSTTPKGIFLDGEPAWIDRDWQNASTTNYLGETLYPNCTKTVPELKQYCGGTDTAFNGWSTHKWIQSGYDGLGSYYYSAVHLNKNIDDVIGALVDLEYTKSFLEMSTDQVRQICGNGYKYSK